MVVASDTITAFFSYARIDWEAAPEALTHLFEQIETRTRAAEGSRRFTKWVDSNGIRWGDDWLGKLHEVLAASDLLFVFLSPSWLNSDICRKELEAFRDHRAGQVGKRLFIAEVCCLTKKQERQHAHILADLRHLQAKNWQTLLVADKNTRELACHAAGMEVAEQLEMLSEERPFLPCLPTGSTTTCEPVPLSERRKLASGRLEVPSQGGVVNDVAMVLLYLAFRGWGEIDTAKGTLVFGAKSATVVIAAKGVEITPHNEFNTSRRPARIEPIEYVDKSEIHFRISAAEGVLKNNVISHDELSLPVVQAKIAFGDKAEIGGRIELGTGDLLIDEALSDLIDSPDLNAADTKALRSMRKALAQMILEAHFDTFELAGCEI